MLNYFTLSFFFCLQFLLASDFVQAQTTPYNPYTSNISSTSAQLNWTASALPTTYDVRWRQQGATNWVTTTEIPGNSFVLTGLSDGQSYEWQMRPANSATWYGGPVSFTTTFSCSAPYIYTPGSVSTSAVQLNWYSSGDTGGPNLNYTLEVKTSQATSWSTISGISGVPYNTTVYTLNNLTPGTSYVCRLRSACSPFSSTIAFATPACVITNLSQEPLSTTARLRWNNVIDATYNLQWRQQGGPWNTISTIPAPSYAATAEYSLTALAPNTTYEWQVQPVCRTVTGPFAGPLSFTANCNAPTSVSLLTAQPNRATISWNSIYVNASYGFSFTTQHRPKVPANSPWTTTNYNYSTNYSGPYNFYGSMSGLNPETEYEVRVQTSCPNSETSNYSNPPVSFGTSSCTNTASNLYSYANSLTSQSFYWSTNYEHYYAVQFRPTGVSSWSQVGPLTYTGNSSQVVQNLTPATTYEWRVLTYCTPSVSAVTPSTSQTFATAVCATNRVNSLYASNPDFDRVTLTWSESSPGAGQYLVRYREVGASTYTNLPIQPSQYLNLTGLSNSTAYEWQVAAICDASATSQTFSAPQTFTTSCRNTASYQQTENNAITSIRLRWDNAYYLDTYNRTYVLRYRPQGADWTTQTLNTTSSSLQLSLTGLQTGTVYEWGVARQCSASVLSDFSPGFPFTTSCSYTLYDFESRYLTPTRAWLSFSDQANRYSYQIRYRVVGTPDWILLPPFSTTYYSLTGLTPYTAYEWQAAVRCHPDFISTYSPTQTFTTDCFAPTGLNANSGTSTLFFYWSYNANVPSYTLQYRPQGTSTWTSVSATETSYQLNNVQGAYEWRVQANCGGGLTSAFSAIGTVSTFCFSPNTPTISALSSYGASVSWSGSASDTRYNLQWRPTGTTAWTTITDIVQPKYVLTGLAHQTRYEVQIQAQCANIQSSFSSQQSFLTDCSAPSALSSVAYNYFTEPGRKFTWSGVPNVDYTLRWRRIVAEGQSPEDWQVRPYATTGLFYPQFLPGTYEWQVQTNCVNGSTSAFVGGLSFDIPTCPNDPITNYQTQAESNRAWLTYTAGARSEVRWRAVGASTWNVSGNLNSGSLNLTNLTENVAYEWQARLICPNGQTDFGPLQTFTTICPGAPNPRTTCVTPYGATLFWDGSFSGAYEINWRAIGTLTWQTATVSGNTYSLNNLSTGTNYEWRIRPACSPATNKPFNNPLLFTTQCAAPQGLSMVAANNCQNVTLTWQSQCPASVNYTVRVRNSSSDPWTSYNTVYSSLMLYIDKPGTAYEYQVQANCNPGWTSAFSNSYVFTAPACPASLACGPATDLSQYIGSETATLNWKTASVGTNFVVRWRAVGGNWTNANIAGTSYSLTGLALNTLYEWQVRNFCAGANDWSSPSFFRTRCGPPPIEIYSVVAGLDSIRYYYFATSGYSMELRYRADNGAWLTQTVVTNPALLTGLTGGTRYEIQLRTRCSNDVYSTWTPSRYATPTGTPPACSAMATVQNGDWTNPAVWSCGRVPLATDPVQILHTIMIPDNGTGRALRVSYRLEGIVRFGTGARLLLGQ